MTRLSVNINKVATLRNARGGDVPNVVKVALDCEDFGADGITVHPRPDERHIRRKDVYDLRPLLPDRVQYRGVSCTRIYGFGLEGETASGNFGARQPYTADFKRRLGYQDPF